MVREWNNYDKKFWLQFNIGADILDKYNVIALDFYHMVKEDENKRDIITIKQPGIYSYWNKTGEVYKIYQPRNKKFKFIKGKNHLQGIDQLEYN